MLTSVRTVTLMLVLAASLAGCVAGTDVGGHHGVVQHDLSDTSGVVSVLSLLTIGFVTGLSHCVGMCGPLVSAFSMRRPKRSAALIVPLVVYQAGRLSTYVLIGLVMGVIGASVHIAALVQGWQVGLALVFGALMLTIALSLTGWVPVGRWSGSVHVGRHVAAWARRLVASEHPAAPFGLGLANGMLPCGPVYAMALLAATMPVVWQGGALMLVFGLGTVPAMLAVGFALPSLAPAMRGRLFRLAAILIALLGVQQILRGLALAGLVDHLQVGRVMLW